MLTEIDGDFDRNGDRDLWDINMFLLCFGDRPEPMDRIKFFEECRARFDFDITGAIDLLDFQTLQPRLTGP